MRINKLKVLKSTLRKISVFTLVLGLLLNTYGIYLQASPVSAANGYTDADCAPPNGTGTHLDKIVFAGSSKVGTIGSQMWVKNCSLNNAHTVSATLYKMICDAQNGSSCDKVVETKNSGTITLQPGGTYNFVAPDFSISCGSAQTDVRISDMTASAGTYYQSPNGVCKSPPMSQKTMITGRVVEGNAYWQNSENKCTTAYPASASLAVGGFSVNQCNPQPFYISGTIDGGNRTMSLTGLPSGYNCTWIHEIVNKTQNKAEQVASGSGCSMSANFQVLGANYENTHFLTYYVTKPATPVPTPTPVPTIVPTQTPVPTPVRTQSPTPTATPVRTNSPTPSPTQSPTPTPTITPSATPANSQLKLCKYEDDNGDGVHNNSENVLSWTFNYTVNGQTRSVNSNWWNLVTQGCAIVDLPANSQVSVGEVVKAGWRPTAVYADGARADDGSVRDNFTYNYTSAANTTKVMWFLNTFTPPTTSPTPTPTATPTGTPVPSATPTSTPAVTPTATPVVTATPSPTQTPSVTPTASPITQSTQLKICKYEDPNGDGIHNNGENVQSWTFNYSFDNQSRSVSSDWWNVLTQGCAIINVPVNKLITVSEAQKTGWTQTAVFADGAKTDGSTHTYTSSIDDVKVIWFLNKQTPGTTPAPTATPTLSPSSSPTPTPTNSPTPTPTATPVIVTTNNSNWSVTIEKRVDGTRVDGDKVGIQYRVKIKNTDDEDINNLEVRDTLPADFTYDQNTTEGDLNTNPTIQDVSGDDNRRLIWNVSSLKKGAEINFGYRTTGKKEDKNYCNDAQIRKDDKMISTSQACVRIDKSSETRVLGVSTDRSLPSTGSVPAVATGMLMIAFAALGFKLSKHIE